MTAAPVRLGIIGLGAMGTRVLGIATQHPDFEVRLVSDPNRSASDFPGLRFSTDGADVTGAEDVDAVYIATPPALHERYSLAALASGKAVFCEKPLAVDLAEGQRMAAAASRAGLATAVNFALSDQASVAEIERADVGEVLGVDITLRFPQWPRPFQADARWLDEREQGGFVREVLSHFVYLTDRILGPLRVEVAGVDYAPEASEVAAHGLLRAGEVPVHVSGRTGMAGAERYEWILWGSRRSFLLRDWSELFVSEGGDWQPVPLSGGSQAERLSLFAKAVRGADAGAGLADFAAALRVQEVVEAFHGVG
ncbi:Gfo/Idh/MocA family protein [Allokutzneria sp. NRRL B-24872]|uniref:Gfo/Idh/MocA family protein n=1 Tax=Allokutzneria sp. NRRL B-24872 TaxID=1137961 RepID=UPI000A387A97|nr:Gfo/Idh/MocA family oxidoreductase [Allokutzneria sp. NRRL B-24872]